MIRHARIALPGLLAVCLLFACGDSPPAQTPAKPKVSAKAPKFEPTVPFLEMGEIAGDSAYWHRPGIKERLLDESGELRHFVNIYVNGEDVNFLQGLKTVISAGDEVSIVPAVAGG